MSRRGDDDGFHPHPGDPWHPEWASDRESAPDAEGAPPAGEPASAAPLPPTPRRRRFGLGRRREHPGTGAGEEPEEEVAAPSADEEADLAGWWATEGAVDETVWEERAAETAAEAAVEEEEEAEATPSAPLFPWWGAAAPAGPPAVPESAAPSAPAAVAGTEEPAEEPPEAPGAAAVIPLDLPPRPAVPPPSRKPVDGASPLEPEPAERAAPLPQPAGAAAESVADELARATAALLAELGEEPAVERLETVAVEPEEAPEEAPEPPSTVPPGFVREPDLRLEVDEPGVLPLEEAVPEELLALPPWQPEGPAPRQEDEDLEAGSPGLVLSAWEPRGEAPDAETAAPATRPGPAPGPAAADLRPALPSPEGGEAEPLAGEAEVGEWLAFVEGLPAGTAPPVVRPGPAPVALEESEGAEAEIEAEEWPPQVAEPRRRGWLRRRRRAAEHREEPSVAAPTEAAPVEAEPGTAAEESHQPPPWVPASPLAAAPAEELEEEAEAEAAWQAWEAGEAALEGEAAAVPPRPAALPPVGLSRLPAEPATRPASPQRTGEEEGEPGWEAAEWSGEPAPAAEGWFGAGDEDEVTAPQAVLPEEEWEEPDEEFAPAPPETEERPGTAPRAAARPEAAGPAAPAEEEWEAAGWEVFPEPGESPRRREPGVGSEPAETAAPVSAAEEDRETAGWETFPEPGMRPSVRPAAGARGGPVPRPGAGPESEPEPLEFEEPAEEWPEGEPGAGYPEPGYPEGAPPFAGERGPRRGRAGVDEPTLEIPVPEPYPFAPPARRQGPISEELLAGAVTMEHRGLAEEIAAADTSETELQALSAPMLGLESGVVGFEDVAHLGSEEEAVAPARSDLPARVATGMVLAALLLGSLWVGGEFLAGFVGLMVILGLGEFYGTLRRRGHQPLALFGFLGAIGLLVGSWFYGPVAIPVAVVSATILSFFYYAFAPHRRDALTNGSLTILGMLWVAGTGAFAFPIAASPDFRVLVLALAATVIATDVGAFFTGRAWGARPLAPVLSPHKTWEGLAGGVVLGIAMAVGAGYYFDEIGIRAGAALGLVVAVMAPLGDLAESMVKRSLGVKDMGSILPGHGGILDRIDAFLFVLPASWVLFETMGLLR